jgi:hypothetical protein
MILLKVTKRDDYSYYYYIILLYMERKKMSSSDFCDSEFNTLGENCNEPINDLTLSTMLAGNQGAVLSRLVMVLLFLYAFTNQNFICHLINMNEKLLCNQMCLTDKMVDNLMDSLANCQSDLENCRRKNHSH